jgi:hypothetical protein
MKWIINHYLILIYYLVAHVYLIAANIPLLILASRTPPGTIFLWEHTARTAMDYNVYLSVINQGTHGSWLMHDVWTTEALNPSLYYFFYIILGKITAPLHLLPFVIYHITKFILAEFFILTVFVLTRRSLGKTLGFWAAIVSITATVLPITFITEPKAFIDYVPWWNILEAGRRFDIMPHYLFTFSLLPVIVILIFNYLKSKKPVFFLAAIPLTFLGGIILPSGVLPIAISLPVSYLFSQLITFIKTKKITATVKTTTGIMLITMAAILALIIIRQENSNGFPWNTWNRDEVNMFNSYAVNFNRDLLLSIGLLTLLSLPGFIKGLLNGNFEVIFLGMWGLLPIMLLPFADLLNIGKIRFTNVIAFVPLSILTIRTLFDVSRLKPNIARIFILCLISVSILVSLRYESINIDYAKNRQITFNNMYIPTAWWHAIGFLNQQVPPQSKILTSWVTSNLLPAYAPVYTFIGHTQQTLDFFHKRTLADAFLDNALSTRDAFNLVNTYGIDYVFFGYGEIISAWKLTYPFLKPVFNEGDYTIYKVTR